MTMNIDDLFTPAPSGVTLDPAATPEEGSWLAQGLANATTLKLQTTAWQSGGPERTILAVMAVLMSQADVVTSVMAQGAFLDFAANGTVTYVALNGETTTQKVTPDPSVPGENPNGTPGWLDVLASSRYNVTRNEAQAAQGSIAIANSGGTPFGPYDPGTYHVENPVSGAVYSNVASLTIAAANYVGSGVAAASNATPITITTNGAHGLTTGDVVQIADVEGNTAANGIWEIVAINTTQFSLTGSVGDGGYTTGGTVNVCTTGTFAADVAGPGGSSAAETITSSVTALSGVEVTNLAAFFGSTWESNAALAARCRLRMQSLSPNGPRGAYAYFSLSAIDILAAYDPPVYLSQAITRTLLQSSPFTGIVTLTVANADGAVSGVTNLEVIDATNASPIEIQTASPHGLSTNDYVTISGVLGNTAANGTWVITVTGADTFTLDGSTGNDTYSAGGSVEGGDLGQVDRVIQNTCVPDDTTAFTQSATNFDVEIVASVTLPQGYVTRYTTAIQLAFAAYFAALPIGGGDAGVVEYENMIGILYATGVTLGIQPGLLTVNSVTLNGDAEDLAYPSSTHVANLSPTPVVTLIGT